MEELQDCLLFKGKQDLEGIVCETVKYRKEDILLNENEKLNSVGILTIGKLEINSFDINGNKIVHRVIEQNQCFGLNFVFYLNSIYNIIAEENSEVMYIKREILENDTILLRNALAILAKESSGFEGKLLHITRKTTKEKLMSYLLEQAKIQGKLTFKIDMNRQQLAEYLGVERSAMCGELSKLARDGVLEYSKFKFTLL